MLFFDVNYITNWISHNPDLALIIVFGIAFIESIAVIGLFMPGWLLLVGVGILIGTGNINFYFASLSCFIGAVFGEYLSFMLGQHFKEKVYQWPLFKRHPNWLLSAENFFLRYGIASIALGRFIGPVRAFAPLLAGVSSMPMLKFQITNIISAILWAPIYLMPGVILGTAVHIDESVRWILIINMGVIVISGWLVFNYLLNKNYDTRHTVMKIVFWLCIFIIAIIYLLTGTRLQHFTQLTGLFWQTINHY
jgi:membrane protein DedA with SNARE-associated domain